MVKYKLHFLREGKTFEASAGMTILEAQIQAKLAPDAPCGGLGKCGKCKVWIEGKEVLACQTIVDRDMTVDTRRENSHVQILMEGESRKTSFSGNPLSAQMPQPLLAAVDIGTTSVVAYLLDGKTGEQMDSDSMLNPQKQYGADVVMRGSYAMEHGGDVLAQCIRDAVCQLLGSMAVRNGYGMGDIVEIVMVGNSCMHHLFLNLPLDSLVCAPYEPKVKEALVLKAVDYILDVHPMAELKWLPNIGGFVGADTVGCLLSARIDQQEKMTLLVDIGTNGEMVLGNRDGMTACSTAAGPAFEGAKITCGMRGSDGAIDAVWMEEQEVKYHVIGDTEATGICGSGLLDAAACLLKLGKIEESGHMEETFYFTDRVFLNQKDIRELQLAKAAIGAGIRILCSHRGIRVDQIEEVLLAGAFGNYLNPHSACAIGMLPCELENKIVSIGNAAGEGARIAVRNQKEFEMGCRIASEVEFLELATKKEFQDVYVDELEFPEEDI